MRKWGVEDRTSDECGADVTIDDVHRVASHLPERKSPGPDRIPNEFYSTFAQPLAPLLAAVYNRSRKIGRMPKHMNDGLVTLLYKKGTRVDVRNYRPITLLNGDYKILTRILAKRSLKLVTQFVSEEQIGFVPNTFIAESAMFIQLMQAHLDTVDDGGVMMFLDMEKAFDRVSWRFLKRALVALRFTSQYTSWIDLLYSDKYAPSRRVYTNGKLSEPYQIHVGTAQGCPLSPLLFLPIMEAFTRLVKADNKLEGIRIGDTEYRIRHFADDTFGLLRNEHQIPRFSELIDVFCNGTNMRENKSKREFVAIGNKSHLDPIYFPGRKEWCSEKGKVINVGWTEPGQFLISLGTPIGNKFDVMDFLKGRYGKAKSVLSNIKRVQSKSTNGKHKILNAHYYGRFRFYLWTLLFPSMLNQAIEQDARAFLWRRDPNLDPDLLGTKTHLGKWISRSAESLPYRRGGAGILNWQAHTRAFAAQWVVRYFEPRRAAWKDILTLWLNNEPSILLSNMKPSRILALIPAGATHMRECVRQWLKLKVRPRLDYTKIEGSHFVESQPLFHNPLLKYEFTITQNLINELNKSGIRSIGSLFTPSETVPRSKEELIHFIHTQRVDITRARARSWARVCTKVISSIPDDILNLFKKPPPLFKPGEIFAYVSEADELMYGILINNGKQMEELRVDASGCHVPVGEPEDRVDNYLTYYQKVARWGTQRRPLRPIIGISADTYPQDWGWCIGDSETIISLSQLSIRRLTQAFRASMKPVIQPPNCQLAWEKRLGCALPWNTIFENITTHFTNPSDDKVILKIIHRALYVRNRDSKAKSHKCRCCGRETESILHLRKCVRVRDYWNNIYIFLRQSGIQASRIHLIKTFLFCIDREGNPLPHFARALVHLAWRNFYKHFTWVETDRLKFHTPNATQDFARLVMARILADQHQRHLFYLRRVHTQLNHELPKSTQGIYTGLGSLDTTTGAIRINRDIIKLLKDAGVWTEYEYTKPVELTDT